MEKAILILDEMPKECGLCPMSAFNFDYIPCCDAVEEKKIESFPKRPEWCPLERVPEPKTMVDVFYSDYTKDCLDVTEAYRKGWNNCLDEIGGGTDE